MIHECLDFILKPLKKAAEVGIMMSDPVGSRRYVFTPLAAYIVDVQEALALSGVAGKTSHITMATYKKFGDPFQHEPVKGHPILTPNSVHLPLYVPPHRRSPPTKTG